MDHQLPFYQVRNQTKNTRVDTRFYSYLFEDRGLELLLLSGDTSSWFFLCWYSFPFLLWAGSESFRFGGAGSSEVTEKYRISIIDLRSISNIEETRTWKYAVNLIGAIYNCMPVASNGKCISIDFVCTLLYIDKNVVIEVARCGVPGFVVFITFANTKLDWACGIMEKWKIIWNFLIWHKRWNLVL